MKLFDIVPEKFFSILNGKNKNIYVVALLALYALLNNNDLNVKKDEFTKFLKEKDSEDIDAFSIEAEEDTDIEEEGTTIGNKASLIVNRLEETGWIEFEVDPESYDEFIVLPSYSIKAISTLFSIANESSEQYSSLVHTTYSELKLEDDNRDEFMYATLLRAYENTKKLKVDLITLSHSIRIYQNRLNKIFTSNEVLHSYFDNYKELVSDRLYHPLKTFDSVARFKRPIENILSNWLGNDEIRTILIKQGLIFSKTSTSPETVEKEIISKINYISDTYDSINSLIDEIDVRHRDYTKASANKILFFNNNDKSVKANLENVLIGITKYKGDYKVMRTLLSSMQQSINFYKSGFVSPESVTLPIYRKYATDQSPLEIMSTDDANDFMMRNFLDEVNGLYTDEKIYEFMRQSFDGNKVIYSKDIPLINDSAFILLILSTIKQSNADCFYTVNFDSKKTIKSNGYIIPDLIFTLKENDLNKEKKEIK